MKCHGDFGQFTEAKLQSVIHLHIHKHIFQFDGIRAGNIDDIRVFVFCVDFSHFIDVGQIFVCVNEYHDILIFTSKTLIARSKRMKRIGTKLLQKCGRIVDHNCGFDCRIIHVSIHLTFHKGVICHSKM